MNQRGSNDPWVQFPAGHSLPQLIRPQATVPFRHHSIDRQDARSQKPRQLSTKSLVEFALALASIMALDAEPQLADHNGRCT